MSTVQAEPTTDTTALSFESAGLRMTPDEFDAIEDWDECYRYELINGVVVVTPIPRDAQADPNELLGFLLNQYRYTHPQGSVLSKTTAERYIRVESGRRIADRLIWIGFGQRPVSSFDTPTIAVEFVSAGKRNQHRDYEIKRREYLEAGVQEYWIFDRFARTLTIHRQSGTGPQATVLRENETARTELLPGFELPVKSILDEADAAAAAEEERKAEDETEIHEHSP